MARVFLLIAIIGYSSICARAAIVPIASGFNQDLIIGATETGGLATTQVNGWRYYEKGLSGGSLGLPTEANARTFTSAKNSAVQFQFQPYANATNDGTNNNLLLLTANQTGTLTLATPSSFAEMNFLVSAQTNNVAFTIRLNFADGSTALGSLITQQDWTASSGANNALVGMGLKNATTTAFYTNTLYMAQHDFDLALADEAKLVESVSFIRNSSSGSLMVWAVSGTYAIPEPGTWFGLATVGVLGVLTSARRGTRKMTGAKTHAMDIAA